MGCITSKRADRTRIVDAYKRSYGFEDQNFVECCLQHENIDSSSQNLLNESDKVWYYAAIIDDEYKRIQNYILTKEFAESTVKTVNIRVVLLDQIDGTGKTDIPIFQPVKSGMIVRGHRNVNTSKTRPPMPHTASGQPLNLDVIHQLRPRNISMEKPYTETAVYVKLKQNNNGNNNRTNSNTKAVVLPGSPTSELSSNAYEVKLSDSSGPNFDSHGGAAIDYQIPSKLLNDENPFNDIIFEQARHNWTKKLPEHNTIVSKTIANELCKLPKMQNRAYFAVAPWSRFDQEREDEIILSRALREKKAEQKLSQTRKVNKETKILNIKPARHSINSQITGASSKENNAVNNNNNILLNGGPLGQGGDSGSGLENLLVNPVTAASRTSSKRSTVAVPTGKFNNIDSNIGSVTASMNLSNLSYSQIERNLNGGSKNRASTSLGAFGGGTGSMQMGSGGPLHRTTMAHGHLGSPRSGGESGSLAGPLSRMSSKNRDNTNIANFTQSLNIHAMSQQGHLNNSKVSSNNNISPTKVMLDINSSGNESDSNQQANNSANGNSIFKKVSKSKDIGNSNLDPIDSDEVYDPLELNPITGEAEKHDDVDSDDSDDTKTTDSGDDDAENDLEQQDRARIYHLRTVAEISKVDQYVLRVGIKGPEHTPYDGAIFVVQFCMDQSYPVKPPSLRFLTPIFHPNINAHNGEVCCNEVIYGCGAAELENSKNPMSITRTVDRILYLLRHPVCQVPEYIDKADEVDASGIHRVFMNRLATILHHVAPIEYNVFVKQWNRDFAVQYIKQIHTLNINLNDKNASSVYNAYGIDVNQSMHEAYVAAGHKRMSRAMSMEGLTYLT